jgi:signal transduction histidine kinase
LTPAAAQIAHVSGSLRPLVAVLLLVALACSARAQSADPEPVQVIRQVEWTSYELGQAPAPDAEWTRFEMPMRWSVKAGSPLRAVALRMHFILPAVPTEPWGVLLSQATDGGRITVNGYFEGQARSPDPATHVRWWSPHIAAVDPSDLVAGDNVLLIQTTFRAGVHVLSGVEVGPLSRITPRFDWQYFLDRTVVWIGASVAAMIALIFGVLWLRRRDELSGLLALASVFWIGASVYYLIDALPLGWGVPLECLHYAANGAFAAVISMAMLRLCGLRHRRWEWAIMGYAALGPLLLAVAPAVGPYLSQIWLPGLAAVGAAVTGLAMYRSMQSLEAPRPIVLIAALVAIGSALVDMGLAFGPIMMDGAHALSWAGPLLLFAMGTPLVEHFIDVLREAEIARAELETRVREREQLLKRNFERLRESERIKAEGQERQRIMQDMHDGLGSQLMSSLMLVERGALSNEQVAQILRESIDDMRLAIDALAAEEADLGSALGNLRYRIEPRLRAAGIELAWDARNLPEEIGLHPDAVLPILRIVQEALNNALKHSGARVARVTFDTTRLADTQYLDIRIADNGRGMASEGTGGRGLLNMRNRALRIGAQLNIVSAPGSGTIVHLRCKLDPAHITNTKEPRTALNTQAVIERARQS